MACLTTAERSAIASQIETKTEQLEEANETLRKLLKQQLKEYRFDTTEGSQRVKKVEIVDLQQVIEALESQIDNLYRRLGSGGLRTINLRRKGPYADLGVRRG
jgi:uncharacterized protein Yka (UPF0111/DUF47 family)